MRRAHANTKLPDRGRRERKKLETRDRILQAAAHLFSDRGFDATTVNEIAEAADVSRATFFNYFPEKSRIVAELGDRMTRDFLAFVSDVHRRDLPLAEGLREAFGHSAEALEQRPSLSRALLLETVARRDLDERTSHLARFHAGLGELLQAASDRGELRDDATPTLLAQIIGGTYVEILLAWMTDPELSLAERLDEAAQFLASTFVR